MDQTNREESLDRQLREAMPYIDDDGFTARVIAKLPARRQKRVSLRGVILLGITVLGSAFSYVFSGGGRFISVGVERLTTLPLLWLYLIALASGIVVTILGLIAAISKSRELQS